MVRIDPSWLRVDADDELNENPTTGAALEYAGLGWAVTACKASSKEPATRNGYKNHSKNPEAIRRYWTDNPTHNLAIVCGEISGLLVLDVDARNGGLDTLAQLESQHGPLPKTPTVSTPGGGQHFYFEHVEGVRCSAGQLGAGLDIKAGGGYVLAPPSLHPNAGAYTWTTPPGNVWPAKAPDWLVGLLRQAGPRKTTGGNLGGEPIAEGQRNTTLTRLAGRYRADGLSENAIRAMLEVVNREQCDPPLPDSEIAQVAHNVCQYTTERDAVGEAQVDLSAFNTQPAEKPKRKSRLIHISKIECRPPDWLIPGAIEKNSLGLLFGESYTGKSFVAIDLALRVATGTPWRGKPVGQMPVVYIAGEGQSGIGRRLLAWELHNGVTRNDARFYFANALAMTDAAELAELVEDIDVEGQPGLIVLDTVARNFGGGDENSNADAGRFVAACDRLRERYQCTVLAVHHVGHGDKSRARGASALKAALDSEYRQTMTDDKKMLLTATKLKDAELPAPLAAELVTVDLPGMFDDYGDPVSSAALAWDGVDVDAIVGQCKAVNTRRQKLGAQQELALTIARRMTASGNPAAVADWMEECKQAGIKTSTRYRAVQYLAGERLIAVDEAGKTFRAT